MTGRKIIHIDMDAFYASVEQRDNPELRGKPVAVGHAEERGVVAAASYEARRFGVRSAMSSQKAKRLCPQLVFIPGRMDVYKSVSRQIHEIFHEYTDVIEPISLDEAFLDVTENKPGIPLAVDIAKEIKRKVRERLSLVVAVTNSPKHDFNRCKSATCRFLFRDTKSARDKNGTKPRKNKVKDTSPEISLVEYLCFVCKGTNLSLEKRGEIPISLIHNSFSYHCTPNVVIANGFDLKQHDLRKSGVKFCFAL